MSVQGQERPSLTGRGSRACPLRPDSDRSGALQQSAALCQKLP